MLDLEAALDEHYEGTLDFKGLQQRVALALADPSLSSQEILRVLDRSYQSRRLAAQQFAILRGQVVKFTRVQPPRSRVARDSPYPEDSAALSPRAARPNGKGGGGPEMAAAELTDSSRLDEDRQEVGGHPGATADCVVGTVLSGRYELQELIGEGGTAFVYKALDRLAPPSEPYVAVKVLKEEVSRHVDRLAALQHETAKARALAHDNIAKVYHFDRDGSVHYMIMELLVGESLDRVIQREGAIPPGRAMVILEAVAQALAYSHAQPVPLIHADLKPENVFVTREREVKVLDFGIARAARPPSLSERQGEFDPSAALTEGYASPEMLAGEQPDARDDVYGLACVAYEVLSGRHPFGGVPADEARDHGLEVHPIPGVVPEQLRALRHGLQFSRRKRTPSVVQFISELRVRDRNRARPAGLFAAAMVVMAVSGYLLLDILTAISQKATPPIPENAHQPKEELTFGGQHGEAAETGLVQNTGTPAEDQRSARDINPGAVAPFEGATACNAELLDLPLDTLTGRIALLSGRDAYACAGEFYQRNRLDEAELLLEQAARLNHGPAALELGDLYDPVRWGQRPSPFSKPNAMQAEKWYRRAYTLGVPDADSRLKALATWMNTTKSDTAIRESQDRVDKMLQTVRDLDASEKGQH